MATFTKTLLSSSSRGAATKVVATASAGTTIHATGTSDSIIDEVWLYAYNSSASAVLLTLQFGGTTSPDQDVKITLAPRAGLVLLIPGQPLTGTGAAASSVLAYADTANVVMISGFVNRIS